MHQYYNLNKQHNVCGLMIITHFPRKLHQRSICHCHYCFEKCLVPFQHKDISQSNADFSYINQGTSFIFVQITTLSMLEIFLRIRLWYPRKMLNGEWVTSRPKQLHYTCTCAIQNQLMEIFQFLIIISFIIVSSTKVDKLTTVKPSLAINKLITIKLSIAKCYML